MRIEILNKNNYSRLIEIWASAVKATHHFLSDDDFEYYKSRLPFYFEHVTLYGCLDDNQVIRGFLGVSVSSIEMLFVENESRGLGIGKKLIIFAIEKLKSDKVDVNKQNLEALMFYKHFGFEEVGESDKDGEGKNYPMIHLQLGNQ